MIVLDEELNSAPIAAAIAAWYPGKVLSVIALRPDTIVKDEAIANILQGVAEATFVTINVSHFWRVVPISARYCIVCIDLPTRETGAVPAWLRRLLRLTLFKTKAARMGKVICLRPSRIDYYEADRHIKTLSWND